MDPSLKEEKRTKLQKMLSKIFTACGFVFIIFPVIFNQWTLAKIFLWSGSEFPISHKIMLWSGSIFLILIGSALLINRNNFDKQINVFIFIISLMLCFFVAEGILRLSMSSEKIALKQHGGLQIFEKGENGLPYKTKANLDIDIALGRETMNIKTNSMGLRWQEISTENNSGKERVAFMGDSQTFGAWSSTIESSFVGVFNSTIDQNKYEVINFGMPGYGFFHEALQLENDVIDFKPKYLILVSYNGNDFRDTYFGKDLFIEKDGILVFNEELAKKMPEEVSKDFITPQTNPKNPALYIIKNITVALRNTYFYTLMNGLLENMTFKRDNIAGPAEFAVNNSFASSNFWSQNKYPKIGEDSVLAVVTALDSIKNLCEKNNIKLVIASIPFKAQVYAVNESGENYDIQFPQKHIENYSKENQIPYLDLLPYFRNYVKENNYENIYAKDQEHLNDLGHLLSGNIIFDFFNQNINN